MKTITDGYNAPRQDEPPNVSNKSLTIGHEPTFPTVQTTTIKAAA